MSSINKNRILLFGLLFFVFMGLKAQDSTNADFDHQLFMGNKVTWAKGDWRYSAELQLRLYHDTRDLNMYYVEGVATYHANDHIEIVPDMRFSVLPKRVEYRPGLGFIYKNLWWRNHLNQLVHQVKWQGDIWSTGEFKNALRYVLFYNLQMNDKLLLTMAGGGLYRWSKTLTDFQFFRAMLGSSYSLTKKSRLTLSYFVGYENRSDYWAWIGGPIVQFTINLDKDNTNVPAFYFNF